MFKQLSDEEERARVYIKYVGRPPIKHDASVAASKIVAPAPVNNLLPFRVKYLKQSGGAL